MTTKQALKIILDAAMTVLFILLIKPFLTGLEFHEIAGLCLAAIVIIHNILNFSWIKSTARNLFSDKARLKTRLMFWLNVLMAGLVLVITVTGVLISRVLFTFISVGAQDLLVFIHKVAAYICLGAVAVHIAVHARYLAAMFKKIAERNVLLPLTGVMFSLMLAIVLFRHFSTEEEISTAPSQSTEYYSESTFSGVTSQSQFTELAAEEQPEKTPACEDNGSTAAAQSSAASVKSEQSAVAAETEQIISAAKEPITETALQITETTAAAEPEVSAEAYPSKLFGTGCHTHCPLTSPACARGEAQAEKALEEYNSLYL